MGLGAAPKLFMLETLAPSLLMMPDASRILGKSYQYHYQAILIEVGELFALTIISAI